jgi:GTP-binding protein
MSKRKSNAGGMPVILAIDGPSGSGKSTVSRELARRLGMAYIDTGAMYRAATLLALRWGLADPSLFKQFVDKLSKADIVIDPDPAEPKITVDGEDVTELIRTKEIDEHVSTVAADAGVREVLVQIQREAISENSQPGGGVVAEGRDIGTVVAPDAAVKFYVNASPEVRATRRSLQYPIDDNARGPEAISAEAARLAARDEQDSTRAISPLRQAEDAVLIDSSELTVNETVSRMESVLLERLARLIGLPKVVVVGRPNVGKSTLINRLTSSQDAVTQDIPGVTRDAVAYECEWNGHDFQLIDTGGWDPQATGFSAKIAEIAYRATADASVILFVVDATVGASPIDAALAKEMLNQPAPVILIANKSDNDELDAQSSELWSLGLGEPVPMSSLHGRHSGDLLDRITELLPPPASFISGLWPRVAIVGKPNVGKSSLLNAVAGKDRSLIFDQPGTTVDPVDEIVQVGDFTWQFIDTAGIRRKVGTAIGQEYYASIRSERVIDSCDLALLVIDAASGIDEQDRRLATMIDEHGRAMVIVLNKWDLLDDDGRDAIEKQFSDELSHVSWAPRVNISALTGRNLDRIAGAMVGALDSYRQRVSTGRLNAFFAALVAAHPHPVRGGKQAKIKYVTQISVEPPTFSLFCRGKLEHTYLRFIERRLREEFGFEGTPIRLRVKSQQRG